MKYINSFNIFESSDIKWKVSKRKKYKTMDIIHEYFTIYSDNILLASCIIIYAVEDYGRMVIKAGSEDIYHDKNKNFVKLFNVKARKTGKGYGKILLQNLIKYLSSKGITKIYIDVEFDNFRAQKFYEQLGFKVFGNKAGFDICYYLLIKNFKINELHKVSTYTGSGRTKFVDTIWDDPVSDKSLSSSILLNRDLKSKEFIDTINNMGLEDDGLTDEEKKKLSLGRLPKDRIKISLNNLNFLIDKAKEGELRCEYCNKGPLKIYDFRKAEKFRNSDGATCDHKNPQSKGGDKLDYSNLAVCCNRCNTRKGDMSWESWKRILDKEKSIQ